MAFLVSARGVPRYVKRHGYLFTWRRLGNFLKVLGSMGITGVLGRPVVWGRPFMLMVEPTNFCNLKCPLCPSGNGEMTRPRGNMDLAAFKSLVDQGAGHVFMMMLWNQGEPYINKRFNEMVRYAHDNRIFTFTSTNGHFVRSDEAAREIVNSGLDEIVFSVDGVDQETYAKYRVGGQLERVFDGIRRLLRARTAAGACTPLVNLQFIVMRQNEGQVEAAEALARELGVDKFLIKTAQVYTQEEAGDFLPVESEFQRYEAASNGQLRVKGQPVSGCKVLWYSAMVNWDGRVAPCCFDKNVDHQMGALDENTDLSRIWRGEAYMDFRRRVVKNRCGVEMCTNCSEGYRGMFSLVKELRG
jgi:MoaA/NifB/PqqE/SkfB family radical SAM enzyme